MALGLIVRRVAAVLSACCALAAGELDVRRRASARQTSEVCSACLPSGIGCIFANGLCYQDMTQGVCQSWPDNIRCAKEGSTTQSTSTTSQPTAATTTTTTTAAKETTTTSTTPTTTVTTTTTFSTTTKPTTTTGTTTVTTTTAATGGVSEQCRACPSGVGCIFNNGVCYQGFTEGGCKAWSDNLWCVGGSVGTTSQGPPATTSSPAAPTTQSSTLRTTTITTTTTPTRTTTTTTSQTTTTTTTTSKLATTTGGGATPGDRCPAVGETCTFEPGAGISSWFTKEVFEQMFPHICSPQCKGCSMLTYECLIKATLLYPEFASSSDQEANMREVAAWLGEMSQETTGGGCNQPTVVKQDGSCSCGPTWCDNEANGGCARWGLCFVEEAGGTYCDSSPANQQYYPCVPGKEYRGRGPKQLSWNYNYGQFSEEFCGDKMVLLNDPGRVASNPTLAWASSIWFWFTGGACLKQVGEICKPGCHEVFTGDKRMCAADVSAGRAYGLGWATNVINGGLECGGQKCDYRVHSRVRFYKHFCGILGVEPLAAGWSDDENLYCHTQKNYQQSPPTTC